MSLIRIGAALLLIAAGVGGADEVSAYLRAAPRVVALAVLFAGVVALVRLAVPARLSAGPYLVASLAIVGLLTDERVVGWERVASSAPLVLVAAGVAVAITSRMAPDSRPTAAGQAPGR